VRCSVKICEHCSCDVLTPMAERSPTTKMPSPSTQDGGREGFVVISVCNPFRPRAQCLSMGRFQSSTCSKAVSVNGLGASGKPFRGLEQQKYNSHVLAIRYDLGTTDRSCNLILGYHVHQTGNTCRCALRDMISRSVVRPIQWQCPHESSATSYPGYRDASSLAY
jgi:hypothetical protein